MMSSAQWNRKFIADLAAERRYLSKAQMMGIGRTPAADEARLLGYRFDVVTVTDPPRCRQSQDTFLDDSRSVLLSTATTAASPR
jgi:hypothetical protein